MRTQCNPLHSLGRLMPTVLVLMACGVFSACESSSTTPPSVDAGMTCKLPGRCGQRLACEGRKMTVAGQIDAVNIFDNASHPQLPFQKFLVRPKGAAEAVEVWVESASQSAAAEIFKRVRAAAAAQTEVIVTGLAVGVDLPSTGQCNRMVKLNISDVSAVGGTRK